MSFPQTFIKKSSITGLFFFLLFPVLCFSQNSEFILTSSNGDSRHPYWSPNGEQIVFESNRDGDWELYVINSDGTNEQQLTDNSFDDRNPSWHPTRSQILFESNRSGKFELFTINVNSKKVKKISLHNFEFEPTTARFSPNGRFIIFSAQMKKDEPNLNLFLISNKGGRVKQLTYDKTRSFYASWAPDSRQVVFFSRRDTNGENDELYRMSIFNPNAAVRLTYFEMNDFCPNWSPNGKRIVFSRSVKDARPELQMINSDGSGLTQLTFTLNEGETQAAWSPDNKRIAYAGYRNGSYQICILKVDQ